METEKERKRRTTLFFLLILLSIHTNIMHEIENSDASIIGYVLRKHVITHTKGWNGRLDDPCSQSR